MSEQMISNVQSDVSPTTSLRFLRNSRGMTAASLAHSVQVSVSTIYGWENKRRSPRLSQLNSLSKALELSNHELGSLVVWWAA